MTLPDGFEDKDKSDVPSKKRDGTELKIALGAAIALIAVIAIAMRPAENIIDAELRIMIAAKYPQFQALKDRYPNVLEQFDRDDSKTYFRYIATKEPFSQSNHFNPTALSLELTIDSLAGSSLDLVCGSSVSIRLPPTVQTIQTTDRLETL